jgi:hypothetical protein
MRRTTLDPHPDEKTGLDPWLHLTRADPARKVFRSDNAHIHSLGLGPATAATRQGPHTRHFWPPLSTPTSFDASWPSTIPIFARRPHVRSSATALPDHLVNFEPEAWLVT